MRWEKAIIFLFVLSFSFLALFGQNWSRYILTLQPITTALIFLAGWEFIKKKNHFLQVSVFLLLGIMASYNVYHFNDIFKIYWNYKVSAQFDPFPYEIFSYINSLEDLNKESAILVCSHSFSLHSYFYYTNKKGIAASDSRMDSFYYRSRRNIQEDLDILRNQMNIQYVYLGRRFLETDWRFGFLSHAIFSYGELVYQEKGQYLYRLRDQQLQKHEFEKWFINDSHLINGSFENWSQGPSKNPDQFKGGGQISREEKAVKAGQYSVKITGDNFNFTQDISNFERFKGKNLTCFAWIKTNVPGKYRIQIYDGVDSSFSDWHLGRGYWQILQANHQANPDSTLLKVRVIQASKTGNEDDVVYVDGALLVEGNWNTFYQYRMNKKSEIQ